jgi:hypothetical protein
MRSSNFMDDQALRDYFKFDQANLDANHSGKLSEKQLKKLIDENKTSKRLRLGFGIVSGLFLLALVSSFPNFLIPMGISLWKAGDMRGTIGAWLGALFWVLCWGGIGIFKIFPLIFYGFKDRNKITLKSVSGPVKLAGGGWTNSHGAVSIDHYLHIRKEKFLVDDELDRYMKQENTYAVYFVEGKNGSNQQILSVEWLEPAVPKETKPVTSAAPPLC